MECTPDVSSNLATTPLCNTAETSRPHLDSMELLEDYFSQQDQDYVVGVHQKDPDEVLLVAEFLFGNALLSAALVLLDNCEMTFTKVMSCSHRQVFLVKGSKGRDTYMCFTDHLLYCSCRSFLEKLTKSSHESSASLPSSARICKHLLALKLMPHLTLNCSHITTSSEEEFAKLVLDRTISHARLR